MLYAHVGSLFVERDSKRNSRGVERRRRRRMYEHESFRHAEPVWEVACTCTPKN